MKCMSFRLVLVISIASSSLACGAAFGSSARTDGGDQASGGSAAIASASVPGSVPAARETKPQGVTSYVLGSGDQISVKVEEVDEITDKPLRIDPDGGIDLPLVGHVQAAGLTLAQFRSLLVEKFRKYVNDPQVSANLVDNQSRPVSVIGEVGTPGVHQLSGPKSLIEVISEAGGLKSEAGPRVIVTRQMDRGPLPLPGAAVDDSGKYTTASISLDELMASKIPAENIAIQPNDVISIPRGDVVYVVGSVQRPGGFPLQSHETISLLQAVSLAQGLKSEASAGAAKILRQPAGVSSGKPEEIPVDVKKIFAGKAPDVALRANDILFIPSSSAKTGGRRAIDAIVQVATGMAVYARY